MTKIAQENTEFLLTRKLNDVRAEASRRARRLAAIRTFACAFGCVGVAFIFDAIFAMLLFAGFLVFEFLFWRKRRPENPVLARRLERRRGDAGGVLTAAVDFLERGAPFSALQRETIRNATRLLNADWESLDRTRRFVVFWNVDENFEKRSKIMFAAAFFFSVAAVGVGSRAAFDETIGLDESKFFVNFERPLELTNEKIANSEIASSGSRRVANGGELRSFANPSSDSAPPLEELELFLADLARTRRTARDFSAELNASAENAENASAFLSQTAREIEANVEKKETGIVAQLRRLESAALNFLEKNNQENGSSGRAVVSFLLAERIRESLAFFENGANYRTSTFLGVAFRTSLKSEQKKAFAEAARVEENFVAKLVEEETAFEILLSGWRLDEERIAFESKTRALLEETKSALATFPGRFSFEPTFLDVDRESFATRTLENRMREAQTVLEQRIANVRRLDDRITGAETAEFVAFVERVANKSGTKRFFFDDELEQNVAKKVNALFESEKNTWIRIAQALQNKRLGIVAELLTKSADDVSNEALALFETRFESAPVSNSNEKTIALTTARLIWGFGDDDNSNATSENGEGESTLENGDNQYFEIDGEEETASGIANFDSSSEISSNDGANNVDFDFANAVKRYLLEKDKSVNKNDLSAEGELSSWLGNEPSAAGFGGGSKTEFSELANVANDAFRGELHDEERRQIERNDEFDVPAEFAEKIRAYRKRLFELSRN